MATVYSQALDELEPSIRAEVEFGGGVSRGDTGQQVAYQLTETFLLSHMARQPGAGGAR